MWRELEERNKQYSFYKDLLINKVLEKKLGKLKPLSEIATEISRGNGISKTQTSSSGYPCVLYRDINLNDDFFINKCSYFVDPKLIKNPRFCSKRDVLLSSIAYIKGENFLGKPCAYLGEESFIPGIGIFILRHYQYSKYIVYALSSRNVQLQNKSLSKWGPRSTSFLPNDVKKIKIPLPSLEIQEEIANKIDKFRRLCIEVLPRELELAQKRYEYYRELLIDGFSN